MFYRFSLDHELSPMERKNYITSLIGEFGKRGIINKFNNSIGFKSVSFDPVERCFPGEVESPDDYKSPCAALFEALKVVPEGNIIAYIKVDDIDVLHPIAKYTYNQKIICEKFVKFVRKVYPDIIVDVVDEIDDSLENRILNYFYLCLAEGDHINAELSSNRLLEEKEKSYILEVLRSITECQIDINQFYCETCAGYHKDYPYHIEIEYVA